MAEKKATFEENLNQLEQIVGALEKGDVPLEAALTQFKQGITLSKALEDTLANAEKTLTKMMGDDGKLTDLDPAKIADSNKDAEHAE